MTKQPHDKVHVYLVPDLGRPIVLDVGDEHSATRVTLTLSARDADRVADAILRATNALAAAAGY